VTVAIVSAAANKSNAIERHDSAILKELGAHIMHPDCHCQPKTL
jgi:hypothetical protein